MVEAAKRRRYGDVADEYEGERRLQHIGRWKSEAEGSFCEFIPAWSWIRAKVEGL